MKVIVIGGGIGGMSLALSLFDAGIRDVEIYEAAPEIRELGVGINVLPNASRELAELGLLDELNAAGIPTDDLHFYTMRGQLVWAEPRGQAAGYRWPQISINRGQLLGILYRAVQERLGAERVHTDHSLTRLRRGDGFGRAQFARDPNEWTEADLLVGCDGVHSRVRRELYPEEGPPHWSGTTLWRGTTVGPPLLDGRTMVEFGHARHLLVAYSISREHADHGESLINWALLQRNGEEGPMPPEDWSHTVNPEEVLRAVAPFSSDVVDGPSLVRNARAVYQYPMLDREPLPTWCFGRVTLLGDAAHPMYPLGSNGASQAILDARVLAHQLALCPTIETAVTTYDAWRRDATAAVVRANRCSAQERCLDLVEERAPNGFERLEDVISQSELKQIMDEYYRVAGFEPNALNARPSLSVRAEARGLALV